MSPGLPRRRALWLALVAAAVLAAAGVVAAVVLTGGGGGGSSAAPGSSSAAQSRSQPQSQPAVSEQISSAVRKARRNRVLVPSVLGLQQASALSRIESLGLTALARTVASRRPAGVVLSQNPSAGTRLGHGALVGLVVSAGPQAGQVPAVVGLPVASATARVRAAGLGARTKGVASQRRAGLVVGQSPVAGTRMEHGNVLLLVSLGPPPVTVPALTGTPRAQAVAQLARLGLAAAVQAIPSQKAPGTVLAQSPAAGSVVPRGSTVHLRVVAGRAGSAAGSTVVPDVHGRPQAAAQAAIRAAGLEPTVHRVHSLLAVGTVASQSPAAGSQAARGSIVALEISTGPGP